MRPGDALAVTARLRPPRGARNPGGFDYEQWLTVNGYGATGYVRSGVVRDAAGGALATRWRRFRAALAERIGAASADADGVALLTALALGERFRFTEQHWADFRRTGTSHLVAVSGMHVALLGVVVFVALRRTCLRLPAPLASLDLEVASAASLLATAYYAALTGFAVPAQRSLVMIAVALAALASRRRIGAAADRRGDARRGARLRSVRAAVGVVLVVVRRSRDLARAGGAEAGGAWSVEPFPARRAQSRSTSCACSGGSGSHCCR